jgi:hypothetical protein
MEPVNEDTRLDDTFAAYIESAVGNSEQTSVEKKLGIKPEHAKGIFGTIGDFIKSYEQRDKTLSNARWLENEYAKPEYAGAWDGGDEAEKAAARKQAAEGIVAGIDGYENAKKELQEHFDRGGSRESWIVEQIERGAEMNGYTDAAQYAEEIEQGLDEAAAENAGLLVDDDTGSGKEVQ